VDRRTQILCLHPEVLNGTLKHSKNRDKNPIKG
jgi:hypothetical protein